MRWCFGVFGIKVFIVKIGFLSLGGVYYVYFLVFLFDVGFVVGEKVFIKDGVFFRLCCGLIFFFCLYC